MWCNKGNDYYQPLDDIGSDKPCVNKGELVTFNKSMLRKEKQISRKNDNRLVDDEVYQPPDDMVSGKPCVNKGELGTYSKCMVNKETQTSIQCENRLIKGTVIPFSKVSYSDEKTENIKGLTKQISDIWESLRLVPIHLLLIQSLGLQMGLRALERESQLLQRRSRLYS